MDGWGFGTAAVAALLWLGGCGADGASQGAAAGGEGGGEDIEGTGDSEDPEGGSELSACEAPLPVGPDTVDTPDTAHNRDLLADTLAAAGYGESIVIEDATTSGTNTLEFCVRLSLRVDWFAGTSRPCFTQLPADTMQESFDSYIASLPVVPETIIAADELASTVEACHEGLYEPYDECDYPWGMKLKVPFYRERMEGNEMVRDTAVVDLASGELLTCMSEAIEQDGGG